jgi:putative endonuclease
MIKFKLKIIYARMHIMKEYYVYIMASQRNGTLYTGITSDLVKRVWQHKTDVIKGFTSKYKVKRLVYYEIHGDVTEAIKREKNIKAWKRQWKIQLIEGKNLFWEDLYNVIGGVSDHNKPGSQLSLG